MFTQINNFITWFDGVVWGLPLIILILFTGILLTTRLGLLQVRHLGKALKFMVKNEEGGDGEVTSFGALCTALSATIGTGNIVGVATAIAAGGPGALFWMIVAAFFGMATKYAEGLLAIKYRTIDKEGHVLGGPFYYIENGMGKQWRWLAKIFAFFGAGVGLFGIGTFTQVNGIASAVTNFFDPDKAHTVALFGNTYSWATVVACLILTVCVGLVVLGGIQRIAKVSQVVVPFMAVLYVALALIIVITILCFSLIHLAPYDAIDAMTTPKMSPEMVQMIREKYGYDQPVYVQYIRWLEGILNGNFGYSIVTKTNIFDELATRIPNTIKLVLPSYLTAYVISIVLGLVAGSHKNKWLDKLIDGICSLWIAMPTFWVAMLFIYLFGYKLRILPILGMHTVGVNTLSDFLLHFITPYMVLTLAFIPDNVRYVRSSTITQYSEDYVMVQKAFGASKAEIMFKHVCKNVLLPVITKLGMALPTLVTGAVITETVFSWPGIGPYFIKAVQGMDYPIVMIVLILSSTLVVLGNLLSDILYCVTDPRIRKMG